MGSGAWDLAGLYGMILDLWDMVRIFPRPSLLGHPEQGHLYCVTDLLGS